MSRSSKIFLVVLVVLVGLVVGALWYVNDLLAGEPGEGDPVEVVVEQGANAGSIGELLAEKGIVKNAFVFRVRARVEGIGSSLQAGEYEFRTGMSVDEAIDVLTAGPAIPEGIRWTVPEGLTVTETLERLADQTPYSVEEYQQVLQARVDAGGNAEGVLQLPDWVPPLGDFGPEVRQPFEGLLFPNTYELPESSSAQQILQRMIDQLADVMASIPDASAQFVQDTAGLSRYDALVLASLVERETRVDAERGKVSGVIYNRLADQMPLQIDATVIYALGEHTERVLAEDLEIESPYNTYRNPGLPPTPISGVGRASLEAAFAPEQHDLLYYVLSPDCDGTHAFAPSLEEHNRNVQAFRDAGACRRTDTPAPAETGTSTATESGQ